MSVKDFIFSKEVKIGGYSPDCSPPPGAIVAYNASKKTYYSCTCFIVLFLLFSLLWFVI